MPDLEIRDSEGRTALFETVLCADAMQLLLEHGANIEAKNNKGETPLMEAAASGDTKTLALLLEKMADVTAADTMGRTALFHAVMAEKNEGRTDAAELLLKKSSDVNARDAKGKTVLMLAAEAGLSELVQLFMKYGASPETIDKQGATALTHLKNGRRKCFSPYKIMLDKEKYKSILESQDEQYIIVRFNLDVSPKDIEKATVNKKTFPAKLPFPFMLIFRRVLKNGDKQSMVCEFVKQAGQKGQRVSISFSNFVVFAEEAAPYLDLSPEIILRICCLSKLHEGNYNWYEQCASVKTVNENYEEDDPIKTDDLMFLAAAFSPSKTKKMPEEWWKNEDTAKDTTEDTAEDTAEYAEEEAVEEKKPIALHLSIEAGKFDDNGLFTTRINYKKMAMLIFTPDIRARYDDNMWFSMDGRVWPFFSYDWSRNYKKCLSLLQNVNA